MKKITTILGILMLGTTISLAQEMPGMRDFEKLNKEIEMENEKIEDLSDNYTQSKEEVANIQKDIIAEYEEVVKQREFSEIECKQDNTKENRAALKELRDRESTLQEASIKKYSEAILNDSKFIEELSSNFYRLAKLYDDVSALSEKFGLTPVENNQSQRDSVIGSFSLVSQLGGSFGDMEGYQDLIKDEIEALRLEAETGLDGSAASMKLSLGDQLMSYSVGLLRLKSTLDNQKLVLARAAIMAYRNKVLGNLPGGNIVGPKGTAGIRGSIAERSEGINKIYKTESDSSVNKKGRDAELDDMIKQERARQVN